MYVCMCVSAICYVCVAMDTAYPTGAYVEDRILQRRERRLASPGKQLAFLQLFYSFA